MKRLTESKLIPFHCLWYDANASLNHELELIWSILTYEQGRKRPLDTPKRMIERRERRKERERKVEGEI